MEYDRLIKKSFRLKATEVANAFDKNGSYTTTTMTQTAYIAAKPKNPKTDLMYMILNIKDPVLYT